jgi:Xaa-Pro aminopeptidase
MNFPTPNEKEKCGTKFNLDQFVFSQNKTKKIVQDFSLIIKPGMSEKDAFEKLESYLNESGLEKRWHPTKLRFGKNTTKSFRDLSEDVILNEEDVFFFDIGPVYGEHEGDYGETFVVGNSRENQKLASASKEIFNVTKDLWKKENLTGEALYQKAEELALKMGYQLNTKMYGHRLGDFPHALFCKESLGKIDFNPAPFLWVLEIHIIDQKRQLGSFYEDLLI